MPGSILNKYNLSFAFFLTTTSSEGASERDLLQGQQPYGTLSVAQFHSRCRIRRIALSPEQGILLYRQKLLSKYAWFPRFPSLLTRIYSSRSLLSPSSAPLTMDRDEQSYSMLSSYSHQNRMNTTHQHPIRGHILHPVPRQYNAASEFQENYGNGPQPSMLHNTPRYRVSSRTVKEEHDPNTYIYSTPMGFRGEINSNVHHPHHPTHTPDHNTIRYSASHNPYSSDVNGSNSLRMDSSPLELPEARLASGPHETGSADFRYQLRAALQPHQPHLLHSQRHHHGSLPHHQHPNHSLNHLQGGSAFYSSPIHYSSHDQEHGSPNGMDGGLDQPQTHSSLEYDSRESHVSVPPGMVYDSLAVSSHSQQGAVRRDTNMNHHHGSLSSINSSNSGSGGSYHTSNPPVSSIPMSNNHDTTPSINTSVLGAHISSPYSIAPSSNLRWASHPSSFDMPGSTTAHSQIPTQASTSASSSSLRPSLRHSDSDSRLTPPENSFTQDYSHLRTSTSTQTLSSSHSHSPSPLSDNGSTSPGGGGGSEMFNNNNLDDRDWSDPDVESTAIRMSENNSSTGRKAVVVIRAAEEEVKKEASTPPVKKKKKSKMHCCEVCFKKFPRPSGLKTHMNTHNNEKPYLCEFPGCTRSFGVRSNAKRHLRTHGVIPTPASNANPTDPPYIVGFCTPMIGAPQPSSSSHHQLHSIEGGGEKDFPPLPGGSGLPGDHNAANIHHHIQDHQGQNDVQQQHEMMGSAVPTLKLRWMPPSLTTRTNAVSLREVVDEQHQQQQQMQHWMVEEEEDGEDDDDFAAGGNGTSVISHARRRSGGGYDSMDMDQRLTVSRSVAECTNVYSPPSSESPSTQGTFRPSSSPSSRIIATSISPPSRSSSFARSNSSLSPSSTMSSGYGQQQHHDIDHITNVGGSTAGSERDTSHRKRTHLEATGPHFSASISTFVFRSFFRSFFLSSLIFLVLDKQLNFRHN